MPCPSSCNDLISTWLFQQTPQTQQTPKYILTLGQFVLVSWGPRTPHPRTSSEKPHDWRDLQEDCTDSTFPAQVGIQNLFCAGFSVSARVCTSLPCRLFHPSCGQWTAKSVSTHQDWQLAHGHSQLVLRLLGTISSWSWYFLFLREN